MSQKKPSNFVLIGRSGSGKGSQAELLKKHFGNLVHINSGSLFRDLAEIDSDMGKRIRKVMEEGGLPFDDIAITLWMYEIAYKIKEDQGILADGFPRRLNESEALDRFLGFLDRKENTFIILIDVSRQEAFDRLTKRRICKECGQLIPWVGEFKNLKVCDKCSGELITRVDDKPEAINSRLDYYENRVVKSIKYYQDQGRLIKINGEQSIEDVFKDILKAIE
ncbi:MAG: nucleoside monophosphate kinase [Patescibacteria group bacterium]|nr:nucleoside monophosphate kinase [Patescibacteria group bacterium]